MRGPAAQLELTGLEDLAPAAFAEQ